MGMTYTSSCPMGGWGSAQGVSEGEKGVFFRYDTPPFFFWLTAIYLIRGGEGGVFLHKLSDFSFSQKLFFLHPFHPLYPLIASLCNVYQCLTLYFERSENTPFSPPSPPPRHGFKAGRETTRWCFMQPISPQVLPPSLKPQGRQREASPFFRLTFAGERRCLVLWSVAGCVSFTS